MPDWLIVMRDELVPEYYEAVAEMTGKTALLLYHPEDAMDWIASIDADDTANDLPYLAYMNIFFYGDMRGTAVAKRLRESPKLHNTAIVLGDTGRYDRDIVRGFMEESQADAYHGLPSEYNFKGMVAYFDDLVARRNPK